MSRELNHRFSTLNTKKNPDARITSSLVKSSVRYEMVSTMRVPLFWRNAMGVTATEAPNPQIGKDEGFYVTIEYEFNAGMKLDFREFIDEVMLEAEAPIKKELLAKLQAISHGTNGYSNAMHRLFSYTVGITRSEIEENGGVVYLRDLDLVVGFEEYREQALFPYSQPELKNQLAQAIEFDREGVLQKLFWVDNKGSDETLWFNNGFGVFSLKPMVHPQYEDGIYLVTQNGNSKKKDVVSLPLERAKKDFLLFDTKAEATSLGKPDKAFDARITKIEHELTLKKAELNTQKLELDKQKLAQDERKQQLTNEREERERLNKIEDEQRKRRNDEEDADRKRKHQEEDDRRRRLAEEHDLYIKRQTADMEADLKRQKDALERARDHFKSEQERTAWERNTYSDRMKFDYDMESRRRKDDSDNLKHILDIGKGLVGVLTLGLSIYAVVQKGKKS